MTQGPSRRVEAPTPAASGVGAWLDPREAMLFEAEWTDLSANAVEPNPFYSPALLVPALEAFPEKGLRIATVRDGQGRLIALAPVAPCRGYSRLPVSYLATWMHPHCFFAAPLIRQHVEAAALSALFDLVENDGAFFRLRSLDEGGPIAKAAARVAEATGRFFAPSAGYSRALLSGGYRTEETLEEALKGKKRKELRRLRARLEDEGAVVFDTLACADRVASWTANFLSLEGAGWKGGAGTAFASSDAGRAFFTAAVQRSFGAGSLDFHRLSVDGRPIAMIINFIERGAGYSFKIAYDETYARFSPGVLLEIEMMRALETRTGLCFVDSCAAPDHPMINSLWRGRREIEALNVSGRSVGAKALLRLLTGLERAGEKLRREKESTADDDL